MKLKLMFTITFILITLNGMITTNPITNYSTLNYQPQELTSNDNLDSILPLNTNHALSLPSNPLYTAPQNSRLKTRVSDTIENYQLDLEKISDFSDGRYTDCFVLGNIAYVSAGLAGLKLINVTDPSNPRLLSEFDEDFYASSVYSTENYAYVGTTKGLLVFDVHDPLAPVKINTLTNPYYITRITGQGNLLFVAGTGLIILDISNPEQPIILSQVGSKTTMDVDIDASANYAVVTEYNIGMQVINVTDASNPVVLGEFMDSSAYSTAIYGDLAFLGELHGNTFILDISDPTNPQNITIVNIDGTNIGLEVINNTLFIADGMRGLGAYNITVPSSPIEYGFTYSYGALENLFVKENLVFACGSWQGLVIIDYTNLKQPVHLGNYDDEGFITEVAVKGDIAFIADMHFSANMNADLYVVNTSDPTNPQLVNVYPDLTVIEKIIIQGDLGYFLGDTSLNIVNISDPLNLVTIGRYSVYSTSDLCIVNNTAYITRRFDGFEIVNITDPANPTRLGFYDDDTSYFTSVTVNNGLAYLGDVHGKLMIMNVTDPRNLTIINTMETGGNVYEVLLHDNILYVGLSGTILIVNATDPYNLKTIITYTHNGLTHEFELHENLLFVAYHYTAFILDVTDPSNPQLLAEYDGDDPESITYDGTYVYVGDLTGGLNIFKLSDPYPPQITNIQVTPRIITTDTPISIQAEIKDPSGIQNATLTYRFNDGEWQTQDMNHENGWLYTVNIGPFTTEGTVTYYIEAYDSSPKHNYAINDSNGLYYSIQVYDKNNDTTPPIIDVIMYDEDVDVNDSIHVYARAYDVSGLESATFYYTNTTIMGWTSRQMFLTHTSSYWDLNITLKPFYHEITLLFYINVTDNSFNHNSVIVDNNGTYYTITIRDKTPPSISNIQISPETITEDTKVHVTAKVTDNYGINKVILSWYTQDNYNNITMSYDKSQNYYIAPLGPFSAGTRVKFVIIAYDISTNRNYAVADNNGEMYSFIVIPRTSISTTPTTTSQRTTPPSSTTTDTNTTPVPPPLPLGSYTTAPLTMFSLLSISLLVTRKKKVKPSNLRDTPKKLV